MNVADFTSILVVITGVAGGAGASASAGAPWWVSILCGVVGFFAGYLLAWPVAKAAYKLLDMDSGIGLAAYMTLPIVAIIGSGWLIIAGTLIVLNWIGYSEVTATPGEQADLTNNRQNKTLLATAGHVAGSLRSGQSYFAVPQY